MATLLKQAETRQRKRVRLVARPEHGITISGKEAFERLNALTPKVMERLAK